MSKSKFPVWTIPFIILAVLGVGAFVWVKSSGSVPTYTYPKALSSYTNKVAKSPDDVANGYFKAIYTEDEELFKQCVESKVISLTPDLKEALQNANKKIKKLCGENWYDKVMVTGQNVENGAARSVTLKFGDTGNEMLVFSIGYQGKYKVVTGNARVLLTKFTELYTQKQ